MAQSVCMFACSKNSYLKTLGHQVPSSVGWDTGGAICLDFIFFRLEEIWRNNYTGARQIFLCRPVFGNGPLFCTFYPHFSSFWHQNFVKPCEKHGKGDFDQRIAYWMAVWDAQYPNPSQQKQHLSLMLTSQNEVLFIFPKT